MTSETVIAPPGGGYTKSASPPHPRDVDKIQPGRTGLAGSSGIESVVAPRALADLFDVPEVHPAEPSTVFDVMEPVLSTGVSEGARAIILTLLVTANLVQVSVLSHKRELLSCRTTTADALKLS